MPLTSPGTSNETVIRGGSGFCEAILTPAMDQPLVAHRAIWVGKAGDLQIVDQEGRTVIIAGVQGGTLLPLYAARIVSAGTTARDLLLWR